MNKKKSYICIEYNFRQKKYETNSKKSAFNWNTYCHNSVFRLYFFSDIILYLVKV
jgi:hypothetical protein